MAKINKISYIRVGTVYYKKIKQPLISGDYITRLVNWNYSTIKQDESPEVISGIPKYDSFCIIPNHLEFRQEIGNSYNRYEPFEHEPIKGDCSKTLNFMRHVFGEQLEFGLDYIKLLLEKPTQILPILCLVSEERNTGKTTFLSFMKNIFGANMTINTNEDFRSQFNSDWASKLIIGVDEVLLDKREDSERIKNLSTSRHFKSEAKGIDKIEIDFFGKFILCSNNEENFIKIDGEEIRYWIRKISVLEKDNINLREELKSETPYFLNYLIERELSTNSNSRMWFTPQQISTEALKKVKENNKTFVERELFEIINGELDQFELEEISFTNLDLLNFLKESGTKVNRHQLSALLKNKLGLEPNKTPSTYIKYTHSSCPDGSFSNYEERKKGRFYTFKRETFNPS